MIYEYRCPRCGVYEIEHPMSEPARTVCETIGTAEWCGEIIEAKCSLPIERIISANTNPPALKSGASGGWSSTGYGPTSAQRITRARLGREPIGRT